MTTVRPAKPPDARRILEIFRDGLSSTIRRRMILGYAGAERFISEAIEIQAQGSDHTFMVACDGRKIVGAAELRDFGNDLLLNHIFVVPSMQGNGIGRQLLRAGIGYARKDDQEQWLLDVFADNDGARRWYASLQMKQIEQRAWVHVSPPLAASGVGGDWEVARMAEANRQHDRDGFSQFVLRTRGGNYDIGRLGTEFFRSTTFRICEDPHALHALHSIDGERALLCIGEMQCTPKNTSLEYHVVARSLRLRGSIQTSLERLNEAVAAPLT